MTHVEAVAEALGLDERAIEYRLNGHGPGLYPRLHGGCFWCGSAHPGGWPDRGNSCPVRYGALDSGGAVA